jgi:hypothetical protein
MRKFVIIAALLMVPAMANAAVTIGLTDGGGGASVTYADTASVPASINLDVTIGVSASEIVTAFGYWLTESSSAGMEITARTRYLPSPWATTSPDTLIPFPPPGQPGVLDDDQNDLDPTNNKDIGESGGGTGYFMATTLVHTLTISLPALAEGTYVITPSDSPAGAGLEWVDMYLVGQDYAAIGSYTIEVLPEPSALLLLLGMVPMLRRRK